MTLGQRIKQVRMAANIRQKDFAERLTVSASYISKVEADKEIPTEMLLKLIALEFNVSFWWLKDGNEEQTISKNKLDYFERNNLENFHAGNIGDLSKIIQNLQSSAPAERDVSINAMITLFRIIDEALEENEKFKTVVFDNISNIIASYTELISKLQSLKIDDRTYANKIFATVRTATVDIEENLIDLGKLYEEKSK